MYLFGLTFRMTVAFIISKATFFVLNLTSPRQFSPFVDSLESGWRNLLIRGFDHIPDGTGSGDWAWWAERVLGFFATEIGGRELIELFVLIIVYWFFAILLGIGKLGRRRRA